MSRTINKIRPVDPQILNELENAPDSAKAYHDANAAEEARKLAERYRHSPVYLRLLSMHIAGAADKAYSKHMKELEVSMPRKRDVASGRYVSEGLFDNE
jgi:hypothetical protein